MIKCYPPSGFFVGISIILERFAFVIPNLYCQLLRVTFQAPSNGFYQPVGGLGNLSGGRKNNLILDSELF